MESVFGVVLYIMIVTIFAFFGRFLDDYDETLFELIKTNSLNKKIAN